MKWITRWIFIKTKFWHLIRPAITFLYFLRSMALIPVSADFIKMISWSIIPRMRSCKDVVCSTKNIKFSMNMDMFPTEDYNNRMSRNCTALPSIAVSIYKKNCQSIWTHNQQKTINEKRTVLNKFDFIVLSSRGTWGQLSREVKSDGNFLKIWRYFWIQSCISNDQLKHNSWQFFSGEGLERKTNYAGRVCRSFYLHELVSFTTYSWGYKHKPSKLMKIVDVCNVSPKAHIFVNVVKI